MIKCDVCRTIMILSNSVYACMNCGNKMQAPHLELKNNFGFTGNRYGMSPQQMISVIQLISANKEWQIGHHGCCIGSDFHFHSICTMLGIELHLHPSIDRSLQDERCFPIGAYMHKATPLGHYARNREIVRQSCAIIGTPKTSDEPADDCPHPGGTWMTIKHSIKHNKPTYIVWPNGKVELRCD